MTIKLNQHVEEFFGAVFAAISVYTVFEVALYAAISAFVGAVIGHFTRRLIKFIGSSATWQAFARAFINMFKF